MLLQIHIVAGALAMILGAVALLARKGAKLHRRSGQLASDEQLRGMRRLAVPTATLRVG